MSELTEALLEVAHGDERAVLLTVLDGEQRGTKLLVRLDRSEVVGDAGHELEAVARDVRRSGIVEVAGARVFADVYGPPPRLVAVGAVDTGEAVCSAARAARLAHHLRRRAGALRDAGADAERRPDRRRLA